MIPWGISKDLLSFIRFIYEEKLNEKRLLRIIFTDSVAPVESSICEHEFVKIDLIFLSLHKTIFYSHNSDIIKIKYKHPCLSIS